MDNDKVVADLVRSHAVRGFAIDRAARSGPRAMSGITAGSLSVTVVMAVTSVTIVRIVLR